MAKKANVLVVAGNGTNCERETAHACRQADADQVDIRMIWDLLAGDVNLHDYQLLVLPGGFLDGDDLGAAKAAAIRWRHAVLKPEDVPLKEALATYIRGGNLVFGICNGFQLMAKLGLVPATDVTAQSLLPPQQASLGANDSGRFEDRWVHLQVNPDSPCIFTRGIETLDVPIRHGEGKVVFKDKTTAAAVEASHLAPVYYADPETHASTDAYPANPNGSTANIAGLCDHTGRLFGLMPHPEAFTHRTNHPQWTRRKDLPEEGAGLALFKNAIAFIHDEL